MNKEYIRFKVSPFALKNVLLALYNSGISEIFVTKEDGELLVSLLKEEVEKEVYHIGDIIEVNKGEENGEE